MPWLLNKFWLLIRSWISEDSQKRIHFSTRANITDLIALENLPDFAGGTATKNYREIPDGVPSMEQWALEMGIVPNHEKAVKMKAYFDYLATI